ncbi:OB-fold nucleic acid binding domain-containing protein [Nocardioidaceae bacterium SCSIO 66511]|nr:OB-fold nucleic acid binding domain-containing protein [Nocardioidaceae bacterium SCSIO 66511]
MPRSGAKERREGVLSRALGRLTTPTARIEEAELRDEAAKAGCELIATRSDRQEATVHGTLRRVTLRPRGGVPALEADLNDGSGSVLVVWLGRRRIEGITPGRQLTVHGRLGIRDGERILFNPRYELSA